MDIANKTTELVLAARRNLPESRELFELATELRLTPAITSSEAGLRNLGITIDSALYQKAITSIELQTCRIEIKGKQVGAGILVAPRVVLTTYQVVEPAINGKMASAQVTLRFDDYYTEGNKLASGNNFRLSAEWLVYFSPYSRMDMLPPPRPSDPSYDELDYALLRVERAVTAHPGKLASAEGISRGFMNLREQDSTPQVENGLLFIAEARAGQPKQISANTCTGFNAPKTRITYLGSTLVPTSGAPIFNTEMDLVAMQQGGDYIQFNQGVPVEAILSSQGPGFWDTLQDEVV